MYQQEPVHEIYYFYMKVQMREQDEYLIIALHLKNLMIVERYSAMEKIVFPELGHSDLGGLKTLSWRRGVVRSSTLPSGR